MAILYITEYRDEGDARGKIQLPVEPPLAIQVVTFGASTASAVLNAATRFVSVQLDTNGHIQFAGTPVATVTTSRLHEANAVSFHGVNSGSDLKIAAITA